MDVRQLERSQLAQASQMAAQVFLDDPVFGYITPIDRDRRFRALDWLANKLLAYCLPHQQVYTTATIGGVAAWLPPNQFESGLLAYLKRVQSRQLYLLPVKCGWNRLQHLVEYQLGLEQAHGEDMGDRPHWYLALMYVDPEQQGQGIGSALIAPILQRATEEGLPCYVIAFTQDGVRFYQKNGFEVIRQRVLSSTSPPFWTLKRQP
jgi:GNAT superfamily N-acetyltransferase